MLNGAKIKKGDRVFAVFAIGNPQTQQPETFRTAPCTVARRIEDADGGWWLLIAENGTEYPASDLYATEEAARLVADNMIAKHCATPKMGIIKP